ncbi:MAG: hypothetical protein Q8N23_31005 [Archangium sp.]|nr:hypothetical protein [Archangium sp.]MDP3575858.1 hypothetical protein [Archangium sp.]
MSKNSRISLFGLIGGVAGFALSGCFAAQPTPECNVTITAAGQGLGPYYALLTPVDGTGSCAELDHMYMGMQRFRTQANGGAFTLAVKPSLVVDPYLGYVYSADVDPANNCVNQTRCADCTIDAGPGLVIPDGGAVEEFVQGDGGIGGRTVAVDGGFRAIDRKNACRSVDDEIARVDATDPDGKKLNAIGQMPQFPTNNACTITNFVGGEQNYQEEALTLVDGSSETLPAITYKTEFTNFNVINSAKVPGTAFTTDMKYTEGGCVANYKVVGFWPEIHCSNDPSEGALVTSEECDPNADVDAGRFLGSGINPSFEPKCNTALGVCVPTVDVAAIK